MSLWKAEDQGVPATNDLTEIEDLTLTAPSPLQRLLDSNDDDEQKDQDDDEDDDGEQKDTDDEEEEDNDDDDGNDEWSKLQVGGLSAAGGAVGVGLIAAVYKYLSVPDLSAPQEERLWIRCSKLNSDQEKLIDADPKVETAGDDLLVTTYKSQADFDAKYHTLGIKVISAGTQGLKTVLHLPHDGDSTGDDVILTMTEDNKWTVLATAIPVPPKKNTEAGSGGEPAGSGGEPAGSGGEPELGDDKLNSLLPNTSVISEQNSLLPNTSVISEQDDGILSGGEVGEGKLGEAEV